MDRKPSERALELFAGNYNCAQSVFAACATAAGLTEEQRLALGVPFGGGMAGQGEVCGALTGALLALAEMRAGAAPDAVYRQAAQMIAAFRNAHGSILCRELTGCVIGTEDGLRSFRERDPRRNLCTKLVAFAADQVASAQN